MQKERIKELNNLQESLQYKFNNVELLNKALTHKSYSNEIFFSIKNNERLEYLGDSVLDLIVGNYIFLTYEELSEGPLSKIRAAVVNEGCLTELAKRLIWEHTFYLVKESARLVVERKHLFLLMPTRL